MSIISFYRPVIAVPPDSGSGGQGSNFFAWEFDGNLTDNTNQYTWTGLSPTYVAGGYDQAARFGYGNISISPIGNEFRLSWDKPWAIIARTRTTTSSGTAFFTIHIDTPTDANRAAFFELSRRLFRVAVYASDNTSEFKQSTALASTGNWNFIVFRYDPANQKQLDLFVYSAGLSNGGGYIESYTFTKDFRPDSQYTINQSINIRYVTPNEELDQFAIVYNSVLSDQDIDHLYNSSNGIVFPTGFNN